MIGSLITKSKERKVAIDTVRRHSNAPCNGSPDARAGPQDASDSRVDVNGGKKQSY